ncbi:MAG: hypothetical protein EXS64_14565 [Candidatus Latescibacteria bacterium]|nr:hypothetical protein [Candidatus Latescibacterota bacterium]
MSSEDADGMALPSSGVERVPGGCLPDWEVADLPAPPPYTLGGAFRNVIGPGIVALGIAIGSGEWILGPALTAQYGGALLWIATVAIVLQSFVNTEVIRYALYTGEPIFSGFMRCRPGSRFWAVVYVGMDVAAIWPAWAAMAATALAAAWFGRMPGVEDRETVRGFAYLIFLSCLALVMFGGKIYNTIEKAEIFFVVWILGYLLFIGLFMVPFETWARVAKGFVSFGTLPRSTEGVNWVLVGAFASYSGLGGYSNLMLSNYVRDKGWGMGKLTGAIPSAIGGQTVGLSHVGKVFRPTPENLGRFREWWRYVRFEQYGIWVCGCFLGMGLPALMTLQFVPVGQAVDPWAAAAFQAEGIARIAGRTFWYLTLLCGFWILYSTQLGLVDAMPRRWTDIFWTGFERFRGFDPHRAKWVYYPILLFYVLWGLISLSVAPPMVMIIVAASVGGFQLVVASVHVWHVNRTKLPVELRPPLWRQAGLLACAAFYGVWAVIAAMSVLKKIF